VGKIPAESLDSPVSMLTSLLKLLSFDNLINYLSNLWYVSKAALGA